MKHILFALSLLVVSCETTGLPAGAGFIYTADSICLAGMTGDASEACYNHKKKTAYVKYANGTVENLKPVGGGVVGGKLVIVLESGGRISISRDGTVTLEPPMPTK